MNNPDQPGVLLLHSGIFPDVNTLEQAILLIDGYQVEREDLTAAAMSTGDWDRVLAKILKSEKVVTL